MAEKNLKVFCKSTIFSEKMADLVSTKGVRFIDKADLLCYNSINPYSGGIADAAKGDSGRPDV